MPLLATVSEDSTVIHRETWKQLQRGKHLSDAHTLKAMATIPELVGSLKINIVHFAHINIKVLYKNLEARDR